MSKSNTAQRELARRLLAHEGGSGCATAAGRVHDKLLAHLAPLVGSSGVQALLAGSARRVRGELASLTGAALTVESSTKLRASLQALDPIVAAQAAEALFGTFLSLLTNFIGQRLTLEALQSAWPILEPMAPTENHEQ